jgi:acyl-CoA synthetase (AMP-forming)/AMP-acid ligase II
MIEVPRATSVPELLAKLVKTRGDHPAVMTSGETITYAELDRRSAKMARALLALGVGKGARIALQAPDGVFWVTAFMACTRIGALVTLVSTLITPPELAHILRNSDTQIFIGLRRFLRHDYAKTIAAAVPGLADSKPEAFRLPSAPFLRSVWLDDVEGVPWARSIDDLLARADSADAPDASILAAVGEQVTASEDAVIVYTSGSTSLPKAVVHTQWTLACHARDLGEQTFILKPSDRMMPLLPAFWLGGLAMAMEVISNGATLVYPDTPDIGDIVDAIARFNVNRVNSWGDRLVKPREAAKARGIDVDKIVGLGPFHDKQGNLIPPELCSNMLGMSESFCPHSAEPVDVRMPADKAGASGRGVNGYERRIVHPETGEQLAPGEVGEVQIRGAGLMSGFYKMERRKVFTADGFYPTGDLGKMDADGYVWFIARKNDMIKTRAANVSRLEVEAAMAKLPGIELPLVVGIPDAELGQRVVSAVVPAKGANLKVEEIRAALRDSLSSFKVPRDIVFITHDDVPRTNTGKIKLFELAGMIKARIEAENPATAAQ